MTEAAEPRSRGGGRLWSRGGMPGMSNATGGLTRVYSTVQPRYSSLQRKGLSVDGDEEDGKLRVRCLVTQIRVMRLG
ncbi:hypothetical protein VTI74DRAFT_4920 [Chaetomium olivicolor]